MTLMIHQGLQRAAQFLNRAKNTVFRGVARKAQRRADFFDRLPFEMPQHERSPLLLAQLV